jgi:serine/threonine protein kinase/Tol biopolymer transport system component
MEILSAVRRQPEGEREAYLRSACVGDEDLLREVADALSWEERMGEFLRPVAMFVDENPQPGSEATVAVPFPAGLQIGQYLIESKLGEGGMSTVWLALDPRLGRRVAIKFLSDNLADAEARRRFQREAQMASSLNHPHIVTVYDIGEFDGRQYLVTEYVDGGTLKDWARDKRRTPLEVAELLTGVADGLAAAHQAGILHRDIKPLNILVARNGYAKLADFGLAKLAESGKFDLASHSPEAPTRQGVILGTIAYMSPEQASGQPLDSRSDIFSFGVVLYEMLFGRRPFAGRTDLELLKTIIHGELPPLSEEVPETYRNIVEKALEKNPAERYQSMREMVVDLRRGQRSPRSLAESGVASSNHLVEKPSPTATRPGRTKVYYGAALLGVLLVAVSALLLWKAGLQPPRAPRVLSFTKLTSDGQPKFGPMVTDGSRIYFTEVLPGPRNIVVQVSVKGGDTAPLIVPLKRPAVLDLSRDGTDLLLANDEVMEALYQAHSLWLQPVAGGSPRRVGTVVAGSTGGGASAAFGADGGSVVYAERHDVYSAALDGSSPHKVLTTENDHLSGPFAFRFSPDAKILRFSQYDPEADSTSIMEATADGTRFRKMFAGCCGEWTIDGRFFVFQDKLNGKSNLWTLPRNKAQWRQNRDEKPTQLTAGPLNFEYPSPSKDDKEIFAVGTSPQAEVVRYDSRSREFVSFLPGVSAEGLAFSPDGHWVVYTSYPDGLLWRSKADGGERLQLTFPPLQAELPRWSHDAKQIVFSAKFPDSVYNLYLVPSEGGAPQRIFPSQQAQMDVNWSPDGSSLIFASDGVPNAPIYLLDLRTKHVSTVPGSNGRFSPHWSPDGRYIAAIQADNQTLMLYDVATQSWAEIFGSLAGYETWSHDGKYIYFEGLTAADTSFRVLRLRLSDRKIEEVADMRKVGRITAGGFDTWFGLAPDNSPLVARDISTQEIYALEIDWP